MVEDEQVRAERIKQERIARLKKWREEKKQAKTLEEKTLKDVEQTEEANEPEEIYEEKIEPVKPVPEKKNVLNIFKKPKITYQGAGQPVIPDNFNPKKKPTKIFSNADTIFREMSFFHQEIIMLISGSFLAGVLTIFDWVGWLPGGALYGVIAIAVIMWISFIIKRTFFQPIGKKSIIIRFFQNGGVDIGVGAIRDKTLNFDGRKDEGQKVQITNIRRHWHTLTGRPVVALVEDYPENVSVLKDFKPTMESKDFSTLLSNTAQTYYNLGRRDEARKQAGLSLTSILLIGCLLATIAAIVLIMNQTGMLQDIIKMLPALPTK